MISQGNAENTAVRDIFEEDMQVLHFYGEDPQGSPPNEFDLGSVELVPDTIALYTNDVTNFWSLL